MKIDEIRGKTSDELEFELKQRERELFDLHFKATTGAPQSPARFAQTRRAIARIHTVLTERARGIRGQESR
jgi:large subunit ribosomal protein L29